MNDVGDMSSQGGRALGDIGDTSSESEQAFHDTGDMSSEPRHLMNDVGDMSSQAGRALGDIVDTSCEFGTPNATSVTRRLNPDRPFATLMIPILNPGT
ncbi:unnamed protein product [Heligmosomoides polygyrus]|uniref:DUF1501 domain-containing protein n=1 Tax=Heligmosomoides polygyrus TaxID=6339 RepID=A0A183G2T7_HELPZ|nr:unnamed protein product [Heligmosomoides polygyrus]